MRREHRAALATVVVIIAVIIVIAAREKRGGAPSEEDKPATVVYDLFELAKKGDVSGYLACFDRGLRETVETSKRDMGDRAFEEHITGIGTAVKGVATSVERSDSREARLRVELVYADRSHNDVQTFTVVKRRGRWLISAMSSASPLKMPIPYGTPAYPLELDSEEDESEGSAGRTEVEE